MAKKQRRVRSKRPATPKIVKVTLPKAGVLRVVVPPGIVPVVAAQPRVIEVIPVVKPVVQKKSWFKILFG